MMVLPFGDSALLVNFEQKIDEAINERVIRLNALVKDLEGVIYTIPAYCSLTVAFDVTTSGYGQLREQILALGENHASAETKGKTLTIPVCYEGDFAPDMEELCTLKGLTKEEVIDLHTASVYRVYMLGFVAGFAYLGTLPEALQCARKQEPRKHVPQGAVGLAGFQTGIYPTEAPGGWQLIGQTPLKTFDPERAEPALLQAGDSVRFRAISMSEYDGIQDSVGFGTYEPEVSYE